MTRCRDAVLTPDCHLCVQARAALLKVQQELGFELERDITTDETLHRATSSASRSSPWTARSCSSTSSTRTSSGSGWRPSSRVTGDGLQRVDNSRERESRRRIEHCREALAGRGGAPVALPAGPHPGQEDGQGDDLLAGAHRLHARQLDADPPRPVGLRQVRQARRGLQRRLARLPDPQDPAHRRPAQHRAASAPATWAARSPARTSSPTTASASWPSSTPIRARSATRSATRPSATCATSSRSSRTRTSSSASSPVPNAAAQPLADDLVDAGVKIIFNYSEALVQVPPEVTVHTSSPAVDLLYALYFYLT